MTCAVPNCDGPEEYFVHDPTGLDPLEKWICGYHWDFLMGHYDERHPSSNGAKEEQ